MPAISQQYMGDRTEGIANFKISVDGKPVKSESRWRVIHDLGGKGEEDITAKLLQTGWTIHSYAMSSIARAKPLLKKDIKRENSNYRQSGLMTAI